MFEEKVSQSEFHAWLLKAHRGQQLVYGTGNYCSKATGVKYEVADAAYKAHKKRRVFLVQRRLGGGVYDYIAIKNRS